MHISFEERSGLGTKLATYTPLQLAAHNSNIDRKPGLKESHAASDQKSLILTASVYRLQATLSDYDYWPTFENTSSTRGATSSPAPFRPWFSVYCILPTYGCNSVNRVSQSEGGVQKLCNLIGWHCSCYCNWMLQELRKTRYSLHSMAGMGSAPGMKSTGIRPGNEPRV